MSTYFRLDFPIVAVLRSNAATGSSVSESSLARVQSCTSQQLHWADFGVETPVFFGAAHCSIRVREGDFANIESPLKNFFGL